MENKLYNTDNLCFALFKYEYSFLYYDSCGENSVNVQGQRNGILYLDNGILIDLISGIEVKADNIIDQSPIASMSVDLPLEKVLNIFNSVEEYSNYQAIELRGERSMRMGDLFSCVPAKSIFKASKIRYGLRDEFETRAMIADETKGKEPRCELDKMTSKVKRFFKRK